MSQIFVYVCNFSVQNEFCTAKIFGFGRYKNRNVAVSYVCAVGLFVDGDFNAIKSRFVCDKHCIAVCCTPDKMGEALASFHKSPELIITDSQVFPQVFRQKPADSRLTSFSVLFAAYKGDGRVLRRGAESISRLTEHSRVLIAEACAHVPAGEDIGRVKLPRLLRKQIGEGLQISFVSGRDFPQDLSPYQLVIHCGACMFNRRYVLERIRRAEEQGVPITNYGMAIAHLTGILHQIDFG